MNPLLGLSHIETSVCSIRLFPMLPGFGLNRGPVGTPNRTPTSHRNDRTESIRFGVDLPFRRGKFSTSGVGK
ncbi:hypothetical protein HNQ77_002036 [Silvibacterium bohemicum]|uniref:Uncharacterized protein n=1 Tax=Silvibacterium bohemicum TaxID=1577686 RepID=A0A841K1H4_9BACT|nr:hypothetical protein [Silvibacterium bohemicum]